MPKSILMNTKQTISFTLIFIFINMSNLFGQSQKANPENISGYYGASSQGGITIFPNKRFAILSIGGTQAGSYKILDQNVIEFSLDYEPHAFVLYGRKTESLGDTTRILFENFHETSAKVNFEEEPKTEILDFKNVFSPNTNCIDFPYLYKSTIPIKKLRFTTPEHPKMLLEPHLAGWILEEKITKIKKYDVYTFENTKNYNDFSICFTSIERRVSNTFYAEYQNGQLFFDSEEGIEKVPLKELQELEFYEVLSQFTPKNKPKYLNKEFLALPEIDGLNIDLYQYDKTKDIYHSPKLKENKEYFEIDEYELKRYNEIFPYYRINTVKVHKHLVKKMNLLTEFLFSTECD